jgi:hypothetical protein
MTGIETQLHGLFQLLEKDLLWLQLMWQVYRQLFGTEPTYIDLMNETAHVVFGVFQDVLLDDVLLGLTRLTDPATTGRGRGLKENLSLVRLVNLIDSAAYPEFAQQATQLLNNATQHCEDFHQLRNRRLAHRDLPTALNVHPEPLPGVSRLKVEEALIAIRNILREIAMHIDGVDRYYGEIFLAYGGGDALIECLKVAQEHRNK